jgi:hypothetical protein
MTQKWRGLCLIALLSMLQCITPLVHANVSGDAHSTSMHFHLNGDILDHAGAATVQLELSEVKAECPTIGMAQGYENHYILFSPDRDGSSHTIVPTASLKTKLLAHIWQTKPTPSLYSYCRPPAQAPPVFLR